MIKLVSNKHKKTNSVPDFKTRNLIYLSRRDYDVYHKMSNSEGTQDTVELWETIM